MSASDPQIRVLSVPAGHRYVAHLCDPSGRDAVVRLPDPPVPGDLSGVPWPSPALDPTWLRRHRAEFDLVHLHFGFESLSLAQLREWLAEVRRLEVPLVYTVHDLENPRAGDRARQAAHLDLLVPGADALVAPTRGAAEAIRAGWPEHAPLRVVPHPHVAPLDRIRARSDLGPLAAPHPVAYRPERDFTVGLHLGSLGASSTPRVLVTAVAAAARRVPCAALEVQLHQDVLQPDLPCADPGLISELRRLQERGRLRFTLIEPMSDEQRWEYLRGLDVSVLPHTGGSHSGWLEECRDLGTSVLAPDFGFFAQQGDVLTYRTHREPGSTGGQESYAADVDSIVTALERAIYHPPRSTFREQRVTQRRRIVAEHEALYRAALSHGSRRSAPARTAVS